MTFLSTFSHFDLLLIVATAALGAMYGATFFVDTVTILHRQIRVRSLRTFFLFFLAYFGLRLIFFAFIARVYDTHDAVFPTALFIVLGVYLFGVRVGAVVTVISLLFAGYYLYLPGYTSLFVISLAFSNLLTGIAALIVGVGLAEYTNNLQALNEQLNRLIRIKDRVSYILAHDIRNSLAVLRSQGDLLRGEGAAAPDISEAIDEETTRAAGMIDSVLYLAKIEGSGGAIPKEMFDIRSLGEHAVASFARLNPDRTFMYKHFGGPTEVLANRGAIDRIVTNLLGNSVKYSKPHTMIHLETMQEGRVWGVRVRDEGMGMDIKKVGRLFQPLTQSDAASPGIGLGLYIVKTLVELHSGVITVDSKQNVGTTITIEFPFESR